MKAYTCSEELLHRALQCIPLGSQTFSKSYRLFPRGTSPLFAAKAEGAHLIDVDGNRYIDLVSALAAVSLGYDDADIKQAITGQLDSGVIFSLSSQREVELAEKVIELVPCAEMVRFGKNGSDATTAAVRLARAYTGRDEVAVCGYHGWHDWFIGSTQMNMGVPQSTQELTHSFHYNDIESLKTVLEQRPGKIAAIVMEPMNSAYPEAGFLESVRRECDRHGALLVFDETVTGFRFGLSGAQGLFSVTPDLATFGKGIANGMPLSVVAGRRDIMELLEEVFYSFTYGGELLSIAAALATIKKMQATRALETIEEMGTKLVDGLGKLIKAARLEDLLSISGHPAWSFFNICDADSQKQMLWKTLYMQEMLKNNVICLGSHNLTYAHTEHVIDEVLAAYGETISVFETAYRSDDVRDYLTVEPLRPLFAVRSDRQ